MTFQVMWPEKLLRKPTEILQSLPNLLIIVLWRYYKKYKYFTIEPRHPRVSATRHLPVAVPGPSVCSQSRLPAYVQCSRDRGNVTHCSLMTLCFMSRRFPVVFSKSKFVFGLFFLTISWSPLSARVSPTQSGSQWSRALHFTDHRHSEAEAFIFSSDWQNLLCMSRAFNGRLKILRIFCLRCPYFVKRKNTSH